MLKPDLKKEDSEFQNSLKSLLFKIIDNAISIPLKAKALSEKSGDLKFTDFLLLSGINQYFHM